MRVNSFPRRLTAMRVAAVAVAAWGLCAGRPAAMEVDFSRDAATALFEPAAKQALATQNGLVTLPAQIESRAAPIVAGKKYRLTVRAAVDDAFVVEKNRRAHILTLQSPAYRLTGTYALTFLDAKGAPLAAARGANMAGFFLTEKVHSYVMVFYAPADAHAVRIGFQANGRTVRLAGVELVEATEEETLNPNPDFRYGDLSYSGWRPARDGRLYTRPDGKTVLNSGYGATSPFFPVKPDGLYLVSSTGETGNNGMVNVSFCDAQGKELQNRFLLRPAKAPAEARFVVPPGAVLARFAMYNVIVEAIRVNAGPAEASSREK